MGTDTLASLSERLGHVFDDPALLERALTHRSWCAEHPGTESNERLEFLGDAVLGLVVADHVVAEHPQLAEGSFSKVRAAVVSEPTLAVVATEVGLGADLKLGKGEASSGGREKASILSDAMEAVIAAVYLDGGLDAARDLVLGLLAGRIAAEVVEGPGGADHKTQLQIFVARHSTSMPTYLVSDEGPDHAKRFRAEVHIDGRRVGVGDGRSKKHAEQSAAGAALAVLAGADTVGTAAASTTISESEQGHA